MAIMSKFPLMIVKDRFVARFHLLLQGSQYRILLTIPSGSLLGWPGPPPKNLRTKFGNLTLILLLLLLLFWAREACNGTGG